MTMNKMLYKYYYAAFFNFLCHRESNNKSFKSRQLIDCLNF